MFPADDLGPPMKLLDGRAEVPRGLVLALSIIYGGMRPPALTADEVSEAQAGFRRLYDTEKTPEEAVIVQDAARTMAKRLPIFRQRMSKEAP